MSDSWGSQDQPPQYGQPPYGQPPYGQPPYGPQPPYGQQPPPFGAGGYGPPMPPAGGWAPTAPMPGGVPLRPLAVGDILSGAFTLIRRNPLATLGIAAIVETIVGVVSAFFSWSEQRLEHHLTNTLQGNPTGTQAGHAFLHFLAGFTPFLFLSIVLTLIAQGVLTGALTGALGRGLIGDKITIGQAVRMARVPTVIGVSLLVGLITVLPFLTAGLLVLVLAVAGLKGFAIFVGVVGGLAAIPVTLWIAVKLVLSEPVVVLEAAGPVTAMRRSWQLVQGNWWRTFGIYLLATVVIFVISAIIEVPFSLVGAVVGGGGSSFFSGLSTHGPTVVTIIIGAIGGIIASTCTRPVSAGVLVLQYADLRMRKEGFDLVLQHAAQAQGMSGTDFANVWAPGTSATAHQPTGNFGPGTPGAQGW